MCSTRYTTEHEQFASYGFVVVALEHRDGSGPRTFVNQPNDQEIKLDDEVNYEKSTKQDIKHSRQGMYSKYDVQVRKTVIEPASI